MENFKITATLNKNGRFYEHFGIFPQIVSLYGNRVEDIVEIEFKISTDQTKPEANNNNMNPDYWGWYDNDKQAFSMMIFAQYFLLNMCFPYGIKASEEHGEGKAYRLEIQNIK